jgi:hypothetical protein
LAEATPGAPWARLLEDAGDRRLGGRAALRLVDDEITRADRAWVTRHHPGPALLHRVDADTGLSPEDFRALSDWAATLD